MFSPHVGTVLLFTLSFYIGAAQADSIMLPPTEGHEWHDSHKSASRSSLPWWSASEAEILSSPCRRDVYPSEMRRKLRQEARKLRDQEHFIRGARFKYGGQEILNSFADLVTKYEINSQPLDDSEQIDIQREYQINPSCEDVLCAAEKIFGEGLGVKILYLKWRYGMNSSHLVYDNASAINIEEARSFLRSLKDFPDHLFPLENNRRMIRFSRGYTLAIYGDGNGTLANASMAFFDGWEELGLNGDYGRKDYVCTHEIGHVLGGALDLHEHPDWLRISGWEYVEGDDGRKRWEAALEREFSSRYAMTNPREDFAETVSGYRYNPAFLKFASPQKYDFMKTHVFGGIEYLDEQSCGSENNQTNELLSQVKREVSRLSTLDIQEKVLQSAESLGDDLAHYVNGRMSNAEFESAIEAALAQSLIADMVADLSPLERITRMQQLKLTLQNTQGSLLRPERLTGIRYYLLESLRDGFAENIYRFDYRFRLRDSESREDEVLGCEKFSSTGIYDGDLREIFGESSIFYLLTGMSSQIKYDYCIETTRRLGSSKKPRRIDAYYYVSIPFAQTLGLEDELERSSELFREMDELYLQREQTSNPIRRIRLARDISQLESLIEEELL